MSGSGACRLSAFIFVAAVLVGLPAPVIAQSQTHASELPVLIVVRHVDKAAVPEFVLNSPRQ
jgi:hypothetical protein